MTEDSKTSASVIYLVRHAQCQGNVENMNLPQEVDVLTEKGKLQATLLGEELQDVAFTKAVTSTFSRAVDTATAVLAKNNNNASVKPQLVLDERIRERELGDHYENRPMTDLWDEVFTAAKEHGTKMKDFEVQGGETVAEFESRISSFLEEILEDIRQAEKPQTILVVSHAALIVRMMLKLREWSRDGERDISLTTWELSYATNFQQNTGYHVLTVVDAPRNPEDGNTPSTTVIEFKKLNSVHHLESLKPTGPSQPPNPNAKEMLRLATTFAELGEKECNTH